MQETVPSQQSARQPVLRSSGFDEGVVESPPSTIVKPRLLNHHLFTSGRPIKRWAVLASGRTHPIKCTTPPIRAHRTPARSAPPPRRRPGTPGPALPQSRGCWGSHRPVRRPGAAPVLVGKTKCVVFYPAPHQHTGNGAEVPNLPQHPSAPHCTRFSAEGTRSCAARQPRT